MKHCKEMIELQAWQKGCCKKDIATMYARELGHLVMIREQ